MPNLLLDALYWFEWFVIAFFVSLNLFYLVLLMFAARAVSEYNYEYILDRGATLPRHFQKPFSLLIPCYNEEASIDDSVASLLSLEYGEYEVIIANDGSTDGTLAKLTQKFRLVKVDMEIEDRYPCKPIKAVYFSQTEPHLVVIDKENGGKADAQNAAANISRYPYVCAVDADSLLDHGSMSKLMQRFAASPATVAVGGIVRVANGCRVENGEVLDVSMPRGLLEQIQVVEYLRAFLFGRMGLSRMKILMIISGAFGIFRQDVLARIGGWNPDSIGEDIDAVFRLHRLIQRGSLPYELSFAPDPICWTQVPDTLAGLSTQRDRWQRGLMQTLFANMGMLFNPRYRRIGLIGMPYFFVYEMMSALIEPSGYPVLVMCIALGVLNWPFALLFFGVAVIWGMCISATAVALEETSYKRYSKRADLWRLFAASLWENFGYRQLHALWRLKGMVKYILGIKSGWGTIKRKGYHEEPAAQ